MTDQEKEGDETARGLRESPRDDGLVVSKADWESLRSSIDWLRARLETPSGAGDADARDDHAAPRRGDPPPPHEPVDPQAERLNQLEHRCRAALKEREIAAALSGRMLVPGAASQLMRLWRDELDVVEEGGEFRVAARDGREVSRAISEWLSSPEFAHFCAPSTRGGTGAGDATRPGGEPPGRNAPRTLGEMIVQRWQEESAVRGNPIGRSIGLRRAR